MPILKFSERESSVHKAIVVSLDLVGFSNFCNQPEASIAVPRLSKFFFDQLNEFFAEEDDSFTIISFKSDDSDKLVAPSFIKFTGDGALMFWIQDKQKDFSQVFCNLIVQTMREFQTKLAAELPGCEKQWRVHKLPKRVRVGIATGVTYALRPPHTITGWTDANDFVGYCVNLAVRLQGHCSDLGFLVHGDLHPELPGMDLYDAVKMKGVQTEPVALFRVDVGRVAPTEFNAKFKPRGSV
jgi:class 3 adenylate cyclase